MKHSVKENKEELLTEAVNIIKSDIASDDYRKEELEEDKVAYEPEGNSFEEKFLRSLIKGYEDAYNQHNDKNEVKFELTITTHKIPTPDGNKDAAYLRLTRGLREKPKALTSHDTTDENINEGWNLLLVHQEVYWFTSIHERVNPNSKWKDKLYINTIARLCAGGLEYAELLKKMQMIEEGKRKAGITEEQRLNDIGLVPATEMPKPLSKADEDYKEWLAKEREKEGIK
jgi:hypothetical protein